MKIHREGFGTLGWLALILIILCLILYFFAIAIVFDVFVILSVLFLMLVALFFRSPKRQISMPFNGVISPADGTVIIIEKAFEEEYLKKEMLKVSIFMSVWNVHLNRVPLSGKVIYQEYHPGRYFVAFHEKSSDLNERNTVVIKDPEGREFLVRQIAGAVARRIKCYTPVSNEVKSGEELGFIKFGSRVDLYMPLDIVLKVKLNDKVHGNLSIIGVFE